MKAGQTEKAKQIAESVPVLIYTKSDCIKMTLHGSEWADFTRDQIFENPLFFYRESEIRKTDAEHKIAIIQICYPLNQVDICRNI